MRKVEQTELADYTIDPPVRGNCLAACVASIFEIPLERLSGVYDTQELWYWLNVHLPAIGMIAHTYYVGNEVRGVPFGSRRPDRFTGLPGLTPWIAVVQSPRTAHMHCVVMVGGELAWDPHPERAMGVGDQTGDYVFTLDRPENLKLA